MPAQQLSIALDRPVLLLVDGHSLAFRAYYAFGLSKRGAGALRTVSGIPTSVCFGFLNSLLQVIEAERPQAIAIAFDRREKTFRHEADPNYKGDREATPEDFLVDLNNLQTLLQALNLHTISYAGYEADDILGTLSQEGSKAGYQVKVLSGDRDLFQLVSEQQHISVLYPSRNPSQSGGYQEFDEAGVAQKLGVTPKQVVDYKALCGDKSDCIPGVAGIGEKTAVKLLKEYPTLEAIYDNLAAIKGAVKKKLEAGYADAIHSQKLAQIVMDMPLELDLDALQLTGIDGEQLVPLLKKLELQAFLNRLPELHRYFWWRSTAHSRRVDERSIRSIILNGDRQPGWVFPCPVGLIP